MKKLIILVFVLSCYQMQAQVVEWVTSFGDNLDECGESCVICPEGNLAFTGYFDDTVKFGTQTFISYGSRDIIVVKMDSLGNVLWSDRAGSTAEDAGLNITADKDGNIYIGGYFKGSCNFGGNNYSCAGGKDMFVAKYNANGVFQWVKVAGGTGDEESKGLDVDSKGNIWGTGSFQNTCNFGGSKSLVSGGFDDTYVVKYTASGTIIRLVRAGGTTVNWSSGISTDIFDNAYVTGAFVGQTYFGSHMITSPKSTDYNYFVAKCDSGGSWLWARSAGACNNDYGNGIAVDDSGYVSVTGSFYDTLYYPAFNVISAGSKDGYVAKYDPLGNVLWSKFIGAANSDKGIEIATDNQKNTYVTGFTNGKAHIDTFTFNPIGGDDIIVTKIDHAGKVQWVQVYGGTDQDYGMGIAVDQKGNVAVSGNFSKTSNFQNVSKVVKGGRDAYILKISQAPKMLTKPNDQYICEGDAVFFKTSFNAVKPYHVQWYRNNQLIAGATGMTFSLSKATTSDSGIYKCVVTNSYGSDSADHIRLNIQALPVVSLGQDTVMCMGASKWLNAGSGFKAYVWSDSYTGQTRTVGNSRTLWVKVQESLKNCWSLADTIVITVNALPKLNLGADRNLCAGDSVVLDAGGGFLSYDWSNGHSGSKQTIYSSVNLTLRVQDSMTLCWSLFDTINVNEHALPDYSLGPDNFFCEGSSFLLDIDPYYQDFRWSNGYTGRTQYISKTDTIGLTVQDPGNLCWSKEDTVILRMIPYPVIDLGNDVSFCDGDSLVIDAGKTFSAWLWSDSLTSGQRVVKSSLTLWLIVKDSNQCWSKPDTLNILVFDLPSIHLNLDTSFCFGGEILVDAGDFTEYHWSDMYDQRQRIIRNTIQLGIYVVDSNFCKSNTDSIQVLVFDLPQPDLGPDRKYSLSDSFELSTGGTFATYFWSDSSAAPMLKLYSSDLDTGTFLFWVTVTDSNGCSNTDSVFIRIYDPVSIMENMAPLISVYPNPSDGLFNLHFGTVPEKGSEILLYDVHMKRIKTLYVEPQKNAMQLNLTQYPSGVYFLLLTSGNANGLVKLMKID